MIHRLMSMDHTKANAASGLSEPILLIPDYLNGLFKIVEISGNRK
jgi:hypothetical protein